MMVHTSGMPGNRKSNSIDGGRDQSGYWVIRTFTYYYDTPKALLRYHLNSAPYRIIRQL